MAVKSTLPIRFSDVSAEFGRNTNMRLGDYLRGGGFVPDIPENSNVPTSLPIRLDHLLGAQKIVPSVNISVADQTYTYYNSNSVSHSIIFRSNGFISWSYTTVSSTGASATIEGDYGTWIDGAPISNGSDYELYASLLGSSASGGSVSGSFNTWQTLSQDRRFMQNGTPSYNFSIAPEVRVISTPADSDSISFLNITGQNS